MGIITAVAVLSHVTRTIRIRAHFTTPSMRLVLSKLIPNCLHSYECLDGDMRDTS